MERRNARMLATVIAALAFITIAVFFSYWMGAMMGGG